MEKDISIVVDNSKLNVRTGVIFKHDNKALIEISKVGSNSTIPGGRVKFNEKSEDTAIREIREELEMNLEKSRLKHKTTLENFFQVDGLKFHEIYFIYEYQLNEEELKKVDTIKDNADNKDTYFQFIDFDKLNTVNLLPENLADIIRK
ncbi:MAG: NUDIX domain-containing protein [Clostridia bacterium]|nr:NUDIX domain-containing protein [Clostridia bacterium]